MSQEPLHDYNSPARISVRSFHWFTPEELTNDGRKLTSHEPGILESFAATNCLPQTAYLEGLYARTTLAEFIADAIGHRRDAVNIDSSASIL